MEIASPVVVNEKGDSRVSRKWERLALRGSIVVLFGFVLVGAVRKGAVGAVCFRLRRRFGLVQPENWPFDDGALRAVDLSVPALQRRHNEVQPCAYTAAVVQNVES